MKKKVSPMRLLPILIVVFLFCLPVGVSAATVTVSIDKATLGQGWLLEPVQVEVPAGATAADATIKAMGKDNLKYTAGNGYLSAMRDDSASLAVFPQYIIDAVNLDTNYREGAESMNAEGRQRSGWLGEFDYYNMSGWMVTVNNFFIDNSTGAWQVYDGDVVRWQFTVFGYGRDIGENKVAPPLVPLINKDALAKRVAAINQDKAAYIAGDATKQRYYDNANKILLTTTATQEQTNMALANLNGTSTAEPTLPDPNYVAGDGPNVAAVEEKIGAIGTVTLASKDKINAARKVYDALLRRLKPNVSNYAVLTAAEARYDQLVQQAADDALAAANVVDKINAIGEVTLDRKDAIEAARAAFDRLTVAQKALVTNEGKLTAAEAELAELEAQYARDRAAARAVDDAIAAIGDVTADSGDAIDAARTALNGLSVTQKGMVTKVDTLIAAEMAYAAIEAKIGRTEQLIAAIGEVSLNSKNAIAKARDSFDALTTVEQKHVDNEDVLTAAEQRYAELLQAQEADRAAAAAVMAKIAAIGVVTATSGTAIGEARSAYDALTADQKKLVTNIDTLRKAEARYAELSGNDTALIDAVIAAIEAIGVVTIDSGELIDEARAGYDALTAGQKTKITNYAKLLAAENRYAALLENHIAAEAVADKIDAIGEVTLSKKDVIEAARKAYDALTAAQKNLVQNLPLLTAAEAQYAELKAADDKLNADIAAAQAVDDAIAAIGDVTLDSAAAIVAARNGYAQLTDDQKRLVKNESALRAAEARYAELKAEADREAAAKVEAEIAAIGTVTKDSGEAIKKARAAYDALTGDQKKLVKNGSLLTAAEAAYAALINNPKPVNPFTDVKSTDFYYDAVLWAVANDITSGMTATTFAPGAKCTRAQVVTFLWRAAGKPETAANNPFTDVKPGSYYEKAVLWAVEKGITVGAGKNRFDPNAVCTRAQVVTFLWRAAGKPETSAPNPFRDVKPGSYYEKAVLWAIAKNITKGTTTTTFSPEKDCLRSQVVTFLHRAR